MTDTGSPAELDEVVVTGQRREDPYEPFPERPQPVVWDGLYGELPPDLEGPPDPCADPDTARDWNADAAAAEAKKEFERRAAEREDDGLYSREWHAFIYQDQNGRMYLGPVVPGTVNSVTPDTTGMTPDNLIGFIHNHPGGGLTPSGDDWAGFDSLYNWVAQWSSGGVSRANQPRQYIIGRDTSDPNPSMRIRVFDKESSRSSDATALEVNPDGQQCS